MILSSKKKYYCDLISSSSGNPRRLQQTINNLLHRKCSSFSLSSTSTSSLADSFASFTLIKSSNSISSPVSPVTPRDFSTFMPASDSEVPKILLNCLYKHMTSIPSQPLCLNHCSYHNQHCHIVSQFWSVMSYSKKLLPPLFSRNLPWIKSNYRTIDQSLTCVCYQKIIERTVKSRLTRHLSSKNLLASQQSAYSKHHST